jgi:hypothetical protein
MLSFYVPKRPENPSHGLVSVFQNIKTMVLEKARKMPEALADAGLSSRSCIHVREIIMSRKFRRVLIDDDLRLIKFTTSLPLPFLI